MPALFGLLLLHIAVRRKHRPPPLPAAIPDIERGAAWLAHVALYLLPVAIVTLGWADVNLGGHTVRWFGFDMPAVFAPLAEPLEEVVTAWTETLHMWFTYTMLGVIVAHVAGAIKHRLDGRDVLYRMTFGAESKREGQ